ncbi:MAG: HD domain-containing protein [Chloroflexi bacterium]|nr:HD domain-containing protein [Chloroflexota bacterium]
MPQPRHPQKGPFVADLRPGDSVTGFYLVRHKRLEPFRDRTRGEFLTIGLSDRSGQILARVWEGAGELADLFVEGDVVKIAGDVEEYLGRAQIIVQKLRQAAENEFNLADFQPATEKSVEEMTGVIRAAVELIANPHLAALVRRFFEDENFVREFNDAPAARRIHHAYLGGLLEHTTEVLRLCDAVLALYPEIDADLLITGALLHDIGKIREYTWRTDLDYTDEGRLVGHLVVGAEMISQAIAALPEFPGELSLRVRHMLVSHHGRYEWGSPRRPATLEAMALHQVEELSVQVNRFRSLLTARREPGETWTAYDRWLGRQLYAGREEERDLLIEESSELE